MNQAVTLKAQDTETNVQQTLTLTLDSQLAQSLAQLAQQQNLSLKETALSVLRQAANLPEKPKTQENTPIGDSLNHFFGSWTDEEYQAFQKTQEVFAEIDFDFL